VIAATYAAVCERRSTDIDLHTTGAARLIATASARVSELLMCFSEANEVSGFSEVNVVSGF
jgi:hypothetical protein